MARKASPTRQTSSSSPDRTRAYAEAVVSGAIVAGPHVRNACRPVTTSHPPDFTYYFISFRCCADVQPSSVATSKGN